MQQPKQTFESTNLEEMDKVIMGLVGAIRRKEATVEEGEAVAKLGNYLVKSALVQMLYKKQTKSDLPIPTLEPNIKKLVRELS
jgi:hypothetical protein